MARYPTFPTNFNGISDDKLRELYTTIESWAAL